MDFKKELIDIINKTDLSEEQRAKLEEMFPGLETDKGEKIRKGLIKAFKSHQDPTCYIGTEEWEGLKLADIIEWLEKKCTKPEKTENGGHKFSPKDWIISKGPTTRDCIVSQVIMYNFDRYTLIDTDGNTITQPKDFVESFYDSWNASDARPGDILVFVDAVAIYKDYNYDTKTFETYCCIVSTDNGQWRFMPMNHSFNNAINVSPASVVWKNALMQKMYDEGYKWDKEKLVHKKLDGIVTESEVEENAMWSEEDEQNRSLINRCIWEYDEITQGEAGRLIAWLKSLKDRVVP